MVKLGVKSLKYVHIGEDVWACGKINENYQNTGKKHMVIYAPNKKQYNIFDNDVDFICNIYAHSSIVRHGNYAIEAKLKIFILTSILDKQDNWCFDLNQLPLSNKLKVIYDNGTVKNIDFNGVFEPVIINKKYMANGIRVTYIPRTIRPFGYKILK